MILLWSSHWLYKTSKYLLQHCHCQHSNNSNKLFLKFHATSIMVYGLVSIVVIIVILFKWSHRYNHGDTKLFAQFMRLLYRPVPVQQGCVDLSAQQLRDKIVIKITTSILLIFIKIAISIFINIHHPLNITYFTSGFHSCCLFHVVFIEGRLLVLLQMIFWKHFNFHFLVNFTLGNRWPPQKNPFFTFEDRGTPQNSLFLHLGRRKTPKTSII